MPGAETPVAPFRARASAEAMSAALGNGRRPAPNASPGSARRPCELRPQAAHVSIHLPDFLGFCLTHTNARKFKGPAKPQSLKWAAPAHRRPRPTEEERPGTAPSICPAAPVLTGPGSCLGVCSAGSQSPGLSSLCSLWRNEGPAECPGQARPQALPSGTVLALSPSWGQPELLGLGSGCLWVFLRLSSGAPPAGSPGRNL